MRKLRFGGGESSRETDRSAREWPEHEAASLFLPGGSLSQAPCRIQRRGITVTAPMKNKASSRKLEESGKKKDTGVQSQLRVRNEPR